MPARPVLHRWLCLAAVACLGVAGGGAALRSEAALVEQVIKFDGVTVEGIEGNAETPETAHRDQPPVAAVAADRDERADSTQGFAGERRPGFREERILDVALELRLIVKWEGERERYVYPDRSQHIGWGREEALKTLARRPELVEELEYKIQRIRPDWNKRVEPPAPAPLPALNPREFAPGQAAAVNPSFVENGFRVEAFWATRTGTPAGQFVRAHFHPPDLSTGFEAQHLGNRNELHGIHIRSVDGRPFWLKRLRYRVTLNRQLPAKAYSIDGFTNFSVQVLVARSFDPRRAVREQFLAFPVGLPLGNDPGLPWQTLHVFGFEFVKEVYIASSASVDIDDVAVVPLDAEP